jgi:response regulator RpfG family c-di-GMP phosphodiesterase
MTQAAHPRDNVLEFGSARSGPSRRILVVDDEETIRIALSKFLRSRGYHVQVADSSAAALTALGEMEYALMLCDVRMPGVSGLEMLPQALARHPDMAVIMITAVNDAPTATEALSCGAYDYLMKPVELNDLLRAVERALHKRDLLIQNRRVEELIRDEVAQRTFELEQEQQALRSLTVSIAEALINAMEAKDMYLRGHSHRVAELAASIADVMQLDVDTVEAVRLAGRLCDVGKIGTRESVLNKPGALTPEEFEHVKDHVRVSMEILAPLHHLGAALEFIQDHHERFDGTGYPRGLRGEEISIGGRIIAAADAFSALTARRAYRDLMTPDETIEHLAAHAGALLDPVVYDALRTVVSRRQSLVFIDEA